MGRLSFSDILSEYNKQVEEYSLTYSIFPSLESSHLGNLLGSSLFAYFGEAVWNFSLGRFLCCLCLSGLLFCSLACIFYIIEPPLPHGFMQVVAILFFFGTWLVPLQGFLVLLDLPV